MKDKKVLMLLLCIFWIQACNSLNHQSQQVLVDSTYMPEATLVGWEEEKVLPNENFDSLFQLIRPVILKHFPYDSILTRLKREKEIVDTIGDYYEEGEYVENSEDDYIEMERTELYFHEETNVISISRDYPQTNSSYDNWQFRVFTMNDTIRCVYLKSGGVSRHSYTDELIIYSFNPAQNNFILDRKLTQMFDMSIKGFFKPNTPDSILQIVDQNVSHSFYFSESGLVQHYFYCEADSEEYCPKSWALGDVIVYEVENGKLVKRAPYFER